MRWSDWHEATFDSVENLNFAGRWTGNIFVNDPQNEVTELNHLRWSDDPELGDVVIQRFIDYRMDEIAQLRKTISDKSTDLLTFSYDPLIQDFSKSMDIYYVKKLAELLGNDWIADSAFYDITAWDATLHYFTQRVKNNPEKQFLIPVDFHH